MDISALIKAVLAPQTDPASDGSFEFKPGDKLVGRVVKVENDNRVLIDLGGKRVLAQVGFPTKSGQKLKLEVVHTGSILHLRVNTFLGEPKAVPSLPMMDFSKVIPAEDQMKFLKIADHILSNDRGVVVNGEVTKSFRNALMQIKTVFESAPIDKSIEQLSGWLKSAVEDRGMLLETKLADIVKEHPQLYENSNAMDRHILPTSTIITQDTKSLLMQLKNYLTILSEQTFTNKGHNTQDIAFLRHSVDQMLGHIEQQQDRAIARWDNGESQQALIHNLTLQNESKPVQLKVYYPRKDSKNGGQHQHHRIALLLDMDQLGKVRVDLAMHNRQLDIAFFVINPDVQQLMEERAQSVIRSLNHHFDNILINVWVSQEKISQFENEDLDDDTRLGRINLKV